MSRRGVWCETDYVWQRVDPGMQHIVDKTGGKTMSEWPEMETEVCPQCGEAEYQLWCGSCKYHVPLDAVEGRACGV